MSVPDAEPFSCSCAARYTIHEETKMKQVRRGFTLADTQIGPLRRLYARRRLGATLLVMQSLPPSDALDLLLWNTVPSRLSFSKISLSFSLSLSLSLSEDPERDSATQV
jgi:hypothetical protein